MDQLIEDIRELRDDMKKCRTEIANCRVEIASLKGQSKVWGTMAGFLGSLILAIIQYFRH